MSQSVTATTSPHGATLSLPLPQVRGTATTPREAALAALARADEEAARPDCNPLVLRALLRTAFDMVRLVEEVKRKRRPAKGTA